MLTERREGTAEYGNVRIEGPKAKVQTCGVKILCTQCAVVDLDLGVHAARSETCWLDGRRCYVHSGETWAWGAVNLTQALRCFASNGDLGQ